MCLFGFPDDRFDVIALGAIERPQFMAGLPRLYAEKQRRRSAFGAVRARDQLECGVAGW